jgi:integrase/recombinase XerD
LLRIISGMRPSAVNQSQLRNPHATWRYDTPLVAELKDALTRQRYNRVAVHNYCRNAGYFLAYLAARKIALEAVTPADVTNYLRFAVRQFRERHGRAPARYWIGIPRSGIHALLKLALKRWPPEPAATACEC